MTDIKQLHYETVTPLLKKTLDMLMGEPLFEPFRLVGGTSLSLRYGHRKSDDIDLFTEASIIARSRLTCARIFPTTTARTRP